MVNDKLSHPFFNLTSLSPPPKKNTNKQYKTETENLSVGAKQVRNVSANRHGHEKAVSFELSTSLSVKDPVGT